MDGSVSQPQGRLQCLIVCINCVSMFTECVCALGFYALRTHNGIAALHGVFISEQILSKAYSRVSPSWIIDLRRVFVAFDRVLEDVVRSSGEESNKDPFRCMASRDSIST